MSGKAAAAALEPQLRALLAPYAIARLSSAEAAEIRNALCRAALWGHPGLDAALAGHGLSRKRLETLAPAPPPVPSSQPTQASQASTDRSIVTPDGRRRIPPRE